MPVFEITHRIPWPRETLFAYLLRPANRVTLAPANLNLSLVEAPEVLELGSTWSVRTRRFGLSALLVSEITELLPPERIVEVQRQGPFRQWCHERTFADISETETDLHERITYEPPGGVLGLTLTVKTIEADLTEAYRWRFAKLHEVGQS